MRSWQRWAVVTLGVAALALTPWTIAHRPLSGSSVSAVELLHRIQGSAGVAYSGYAESVGTLSLPAVDEVNDIAALFGGRSQLRVWWRSPTDWRLDAISVFGESDIHRDRAGTWNWDYERNRATRVTVFAEPTLRLPAGRDLLPPDVGRRLLSEARPGEIRRIGARVIAGVTAAGLQLVPAEAQSSVRRVDVWADPSSGLTLRVDVYGAAKAAAVSTSFLDLAVGSPAASTTAFAPPVGARLSSRGPRDLLNGIDRFTDATPPATLAGLNPVRRDGAESVGVYGRGVTSLVLTPMPADIARELRSRLVGLSAQAEDDPRIAAAFGPVHVMLFTDRGARNWLLTGTVTPATLEKAADQLAADPPRRR